MLLLKTKRLLSETAQNPFTGAEVGLAARRIQELSKGDAASALATASQHSKIDPEVARRRAIVKQNSTSGTKAICVLLDGNEVPLPPGPNWEAFSTHKEPWEDAYNTQIMHRLRPELASEPAS